MTEISVCIGTSCHLKGSFNIVQAFQQQIEEKRLHDKVSVRGNFCMKTCSQAGVTVSLNGEKYNVAPESAHEFFNEKVLPLI